MQLLEQLQTLSSIGKEEYCCLSSTLRGCKDKPFEAEMTKLCKPVEQVMPPIVKEVEEEKEMVANLHANFHEWQ